MNVKLRDRIIAYFYILTLISGFIYLFAKPLIMLLNLCSLFGAYCDIFTKLFYNPIIYSILLIGFIFAFTRLIAGSIKKFNYLKGFRLYKHDDHKLNTIISAFENLRIYIKESKRPEAFSSGIFKQSLYLSTGTIEGLKESELKALIYHEIAHILNNDVAHVAIARFVSDIFFYLPILRSVSNRWETEKEYFADKLASIQTNDNTSVVDALLRISSVHLAQNQLTAFSSGKTDVLNRIHKLEGKEVKHKFSKLVFMVTIITALLVAFLTINASAVVTKECRMHQPAIVKHTCKL